MTTSTPSCEMKDVSILLIDALVRPELGQHEYAARRAVVASMFLWAYSWNGRLAREGCDPDTADRRWFGVHFSSSVRVLSQDLYHLVRKGTLSSSLEPVSDELFWPTTLDEVSSLIQNMVWLYEHVTDWETDEPRTLPHWAKIRPHVSVADQNLLKRVQDAICDSVTLDQAANLSEIAVPRKEWGLVENRIRRARILEDIFDVNRVSRALKVNR